MVQQVTRALALPLAIAVVLPVFGKQCCTVDRPHRACNTNTYSSGSTQAFCSTSNCVPGSGFCDSDDSSSSATSTDFEEVDDILLSEPDTNMAAVVQSNILPLLAPSPTEAAPVAAVHTPWKPTPFHDYVHRPSYVIDNGERAPNQVWN